MAETRPLVESRVGGPLAILVSAVWYGPVIYKHGWVFVNEFFVQHHFARYLSNKYHHPQPFYFYPAILLMLTVAMDVVSYRRVHSGKELELARTAELQSSLVFFIWLDIVSGALLLLLRFEASRVHPASASGSIDLD